MESMPLSLKVYWGFLYQAISGMGEPRKASNAMRYSLKDPILGAKECIFYSMRIISGASAADAEPSREKQCSNPLWGHRDSEHASNPQHFGQDISAEAVCSVY